ncbi:ATP-binding protein [Motilibacter aurantiacus]|uniref:ATP-binding protein n=1 Tax=Motilibacter aurantiacus TaxID=2714955 RepID=UPI00140A6C14|nr:BTAD domain-containing putative transcriptional regulator [Motilibacter aurantiacus]NHC44848.1 AAA family ATPase [Motilibacter aurantiacus]
MPTEDSVHFAVLGPLTVSTAGRPVEPAAPAQRALLAALLVDAPRVVSLETLANRLWEDRPPAAGVRNLHAHVSRLRRALEPHRPDDWTVLVTRAPGYQLDVDPDSVDAVVFESEARRARQLADAGDTVAARERLAAALALWRGTAYADVPQLFARAEAARLEELRQGAFELACDLDLALGRHAELAEQLPSLVRAQPLREPLRAALMLALYRSGRQADALAVFTEGREALADELGVDPGRELSELHTRILRQDPALDLASTVSTVSTASTASAAPPPAPAVAAAPAAAPSSAPAPAAEPAPGPAPASPHAPGVLVGRADELVALTGALSAAAGGSPRTVVLVGEAGIGKTRLAEEAAAVGAADGAVVAWGRCWEHEGAPALWPWAQALQSLAESVGPEVTRAALAGRAADVAQVVPGLRPLVDEPATDAPSPDVARVRLYDAVAAFLTVLGRDRPLLLVLEDLHWGDAASRQLAEYVAATLRDTRVAVVVTVRLPNDSRDPQSARMLAELARGAGTLRLDLAGLAASDVEAYVAAASGSEVPPGVADAIRGRTDGNPFYIAELVRALTTEGTLASPAEAAVPGTVRDVITSRLRALGPEEGELLRAVAVTGRAFDLALLQEVTGLADADLDDRLDRATAAGIFVSEPDHPGRYRFAHALVQETLLEQTGPARRARLHARAGAALERRHADDLAGHAEELAHHFRAAGSAATAPQAVRYSLLAAESARSRWAYEDAEQHLRAAIVAAQLLPPGDRAEQELAARVALGSLLTHTLGYNAPEVGAQRRRALELAREAGSHGELLSALWGTWGHALVGADLDTADQLTDEMSQAAQSTGDDMLLLAAHHARGQVRWHQARLAEADAELLVALPLADAAGPRIPLELFLQHPVAVLRGWRSIVLAMMGRLEESAAAAAEAWDRVDEQADPYTASYIKVLESWRHVWLDDPEQATAHSEYGLAIATRHGFAQMQAFSLPPHGWGVARSQGRVEEGIGEVRAALTAFGQLGRHMFAHLMLGVLAELQLLSGAPEDAAATLERAFAESASTGERFFLAELHRLRAASRQALGAPSRDVSTELRTAVAVAREQGAGLFEARARALLPMSVVSSA